MGGRFYGVEFVGGSMGFRRRDLGTGNMWGL